MSSSDLHHKETYVELYWTRKRMDLQNVTSPVGLEPTASGLEVRRAIHCATGTAEQKIF